MEEVHLERMQEEEQVGEVKWFWRGKGQGLLVLQCVPVIIVHKNA